MKTWRHLLAGVTALGIAGAVPVDAHAGNFFDFLFAGGKRRQTFPPPPPPAHPRQAKAASKARSGGGVPVVKITAPEYYNFRADALTAVNFAPLTALSSSASLDPQLGGTVFRESLTGLDGFELLAEKPFGEALLAYYAASPDFIWITDGRPNERAEAAMRVLRDAGSYGLDPQDYAVSAPMAATPDTPDAHREMIRYEMTMSARVMRYLRDAGSGRLDPNRLSGYHDFALKPFDGKAELARMLRAQKTEAAMLAVHPQMPEYGMLRGELSKLEGHAPAEPEITVNPNLTLNPGESSPDLPNLLQVVARGLPPEDTDDAAMLVAFQGSEIYDRELVPLIKAAQKRAGVRADGVIGPRTVKALTGGGAATIDPAEKIEKVKIALEQLRWMPRLLGATRVFINEPAFTVTYREDNADKLSMRVVVGKPTNQTSFFVDQIEQVDFNPYWGIPQSILVNEMLPRLRRDPGYLDRAGYEVFNAKGKKVSSSSVSWGKYGSKLPFNVRQVPSEANALGELKILFPNKHAIYMHDTPQKKFFKEEVRAFSHGCVRLENPRAMAAAVLGTSVDYVAEKLKKGHSSQRVTRDIPVYIAYFTAWPDTAGNVGYFRDIYDRDEHLAEALEKVEQVRNPAS